MIVEILLFLFLVLVLRLLEEIPTASDAPPRHTSRGFLHWRLSDDGPGASRIVPIGRHPKPFTGADIPSEFNS